MRRGTDMRIDGLRWAAAGVAAAFLLTTCVAAVPAEPPDLGPLDVGLLLLKLGPRDLRVKPEYTDDLVGGGKLRLNYVTDGLRGAVSSVSAGLELGDELTSGDGPSAALEALVPLLGHGHIEVAPPPGLLHETAPLAAALASPDGREALDPAAPGFEPIPDLPIELRRALAELVYGVGRANDLWARTAGDLTPEDEALIRSTLPLLLDQEPRLAEADVLSALRAANHIDPRTMLIAATTVWGSVEAARAHLAQLPDQTGVLAAEGAEPGVLYATDTSFGRLVVGDASGSIHDTDVAILIDLGGDDHYESTSDTPQVPRVSVVIDLAGDDTYSPHGAPGPGSAMLGISALVDESGQDLYETRETLSFGSAICGAGLLFDASGDDRYLGDILTQGAAMFGVGLLFDAQGEDTYDAALCGQGFGCVGGIGALVDRAGHDRYRAGSKYSIPAQGEEEMLALSQGVGLGLRRLAPGGVGVLADAEGADNYMADARAQGTGWWFGSGLLYDRAGDDQYQGGPFSQGTGNFLATGHILDMSGDDSYEAPAYCQGFARDRGVGVLRDVEGNDTYVATRIAHGAATGGGIAIAVDLAGDDTYSARDDSQGYVPEGRSSSTIALFADGGGQDSYAGSTRDNLCWFTGRLGVGIDVNDGDLSAVKARVRSVGTSAGAPLAITIGPVPIAPPVDLDGGAGLDALYAQATTAKDQGQRQTALRALRQIGEEAADYIAPMLGDRDRTDAEEARKVLVQIGSPAVPALLRVMEEAEVDTDAAMVAMRALADIGDPRAAKHLVEQAQSSRWRIRAAAAGGMGSLAGEDTRLALEDLLNDPDEDVRRSAITALRLRGATDSATAISDRLGDPAFSVRFAAADALVSLGVRCPDHVHSLVGDGDPAIRHLSVETCGRLVSTASLPVLLGMLRSDAWADRAFAAEAICYVGATSACDDLKAALAQETNGLVLAKADAAIRSTRFCGMEP